MKRESRLATLGNIALFLSLGVVAAATAASAQQSERRMLPEGLPGYVDFERFGSFDLDDLTVEINLGGNLLNLLSGALEGEEDEFSQLLSSLDLIRVNVFELPEGRQSAAERMNSAVTDLRRQGWETVVRIHQEEEIHILIRSDDDLILGLLATWADPAGSVGMVNIVGSFDPALLARLARQLDIDALEDVDLGSLDKSEQDP